MAEKQEQQHCKECGSSHFVEGMLRHAWIAKASSLTGFGGRVWVRAVFCRDCGLIQSMRVVNPERFK